MPTRLSQNFLKDKNIAKKIIKYGDINENDVVFEIGPGRGILTKELCKKAKKVIVVEKDIRLVEYLKRLNIDNIEIIHGDILKIEWPKFDKLVSNLPYAISTPITFELFKHKWKLAILMYQEEFGKRMLAKPCCKDYSRLTIAVNYYCDSKKLLIVSKNKFKPVPKVNSMILKLIPKSSKTPIHKDFWKTVDLLFKQKKKIVRAALKVSKIKKEEIKLINDNLLKKRVFCCSINDINEISSVLHE